MHIQLAPKHIVPFEMPRLAAGEGMGCTLALLAVSGIAVWLSITLSLFHADMQFGTTMVSCSSDQAALAQCRQQWLGGRRVTRFLWELTIRLSFAMLQAGRLRSRVIRLVALMRWHGHQGE